MAAQEVFEVAPPAARSTTVTSFATATSSQPVPGVEEAEVGVVAMRICESSACGESAAHSAAVRGAESAQVDAATSAA